MLRNLGCRAERAFRWSAVGRQFRIGRASSGASHVNTGAAADEYSRATADWLSQAANVAVPRSRIELAKPADAGQHNAAFNRESEHLRHSRNEPKRIPVRNIAGYARCAKRFHAGHWFFSFGFVQFRLAQFRFVQFRLVALDLRK